jgi:hypothetical protein
MHFGDTCQRTGHYYIRSGTNAFLVKSEKQQPTINVEAAFPAYYRHSFQSNPPTQK